MVKPETSIADQHKSVVFTDLGQIPFSKAWAYQEKLLKLNTDIKLQNRKLPDSQRAVTTNYLLFCSHPPVYTLGKSGNEKHLLIDQENLKAHNVDFFKINRGGDITFHGPGQVVGYPILDLDHFFTDLHKYLRLLEETVIRTLADYGLMGGRIKGATGVWLDAKDPKKARKICAFGVRCSRWVTMHGWALNVNTNLDYFKHIVPCGIIDKGVTSLHKELEVNHVDKDEVKHRLKTHFGELFEVKNWKETSVQLIE